MFNPFDVWSRMAAAGFAMQQTALRVTETLVASNHVIEARLGVIDTAIRDPLNADHGELLEMGTEKVAAFSSSARAVSKGWWSMQSMMLAQAQDMAAMVTRGRPPTPKEIGRLTNRAVAMVETASRTDQKSLKPVHGRATANARRLSHKGKADQVG